MTRQATARVGAITFSADGGVLATASDDGSIHVWDVPTASLRETFEGHAAAASGRSSARTAPRSTRARATAA